VLNTTLAREGFDAFYGPDKQCQLRHLGTGAVARSAASPHRPFTAAERERRELLTQYLEQALEDELIEEVLLPLFRQLGFHRITAAGHKDKALEYGKDVWMRFTLPTQHVLYFGIQAKKGKLDASGVSHDHAFIVAGGEITKGARNWLGGKLDVTKRSQFVRTRGSALHSCDRWHEMLHHDSCSCREFLRKR
jgi:hypothetical protein